jgi:hypothetical protein
MVANPSSKPRSTWFQKPAPIEHFYRFSCRAHLYLFAGPIDWLAKNGEVVPDKAVCNFVHRSENHGLDRSSVVLFDVPVIGEVENTLRDAADQMAEILARQQFLKTNLQYRNGKLDDLDWSFLG